MTKTPEARSPKTPRARSKRQLTLHKLEKLAASTPYSAEASAAREKAEELKIHTEIVQVAPASERDPGEVTEGHWYRDGDTIVICDGEGAQLPHREVPSRARLLPDQTARQVARRLIKEMHGAADTDGGFYRKLRYPNRSQV